MRKQPLRVIALLATYNEERFIVGCLEHLFAQGVLVYLIDNGSTDRTVTLADAHLGRGVEDIEIIPRGDRFALQPILERKELLATSLEADWFIHGAPDEVHVAPRSRQTLAEALAEANAAGYHAVNFLEFTFVPTLEAPDHDHAQFRETMRHYYPFLPSFPHQLRAWKRQDGTVDLTTTGGHKVSFPGLRMYPTSFRMRHYLFLSRQHAVEKYAPRIRVHEELVRGWGGWRNLVAGAERAWDPDLVVLPAQSELWSYVSDDLLDASHPLTKHAWAERWAARVASGGGEEAGVD